MEDEDNDVDEDVHDDDDDNGMLVMMMMMMMMMIGASTTKEGRVYTDEVKRLLLSFYPPHLTFL